MFGGSAGLFEVFTASREIRAAHYGHKRAVFVHLSCFYELGGGKKNHYKDLNSDPHNHKVDVIE